MTKAEAYTLARLAGAGETEAATRAGFADGKSSQQARQMYRYALLYYGKDCEEARQWLHSRIKERVQQVRSLKAQLRACELMESVG
jgi:hypothetical protein